MCKMIVGIVGYSVESILVKRYKIIAKLLKFVAQYRTKSFPIIVLYKIFFQTILYWQISLPSIRSTKICFLIVKECHYIWKTDVEGIYYIDIMANIWKTSLWKLLLCDTTCVYGKLHSVKNITYKLYQKKLYGVDKIGLAYCLL